MKVKKTFLKSITVALALLVLIGSGHTFVSGQSDESQDRSIEGVWRTAMTLRNCQTGAPLPVPVLRGLNTFNKGGTMAEWGVGPGQTPAMRGPGHGTWKHEKSWNEYSSTFLHYRYDAAGTFLGSVRITSAVLLGESGDEFTTIASINILDPDYNVIGTGCATAIATRFE